MTGKEQEFKFTVAGLTYTIYTKIKGVTLMVNSFFEPFISENKEVDLRVEVKNINSNFIQQQKCLFKAPNPYNKSEMPLWAIYGDEKIRYILVSDVKGEKFPVLAAKIDMNNRNWEIYKNIDASEKHLDPLDYPMGILIIYYLTSIENGLMIHASGVDYQKVGMLFTAFSGTGKSTMANLWLKNGGNVINDDRLIIRKIKDKYFIYNTPMYYADSPKFVELKQIFLINQSKENYIKPINGSIAGSRLMAFCIQHNYDKVMVKKMIENINSLVKEVGVNELGFVPDKEIVKLIKEKHIGQ